MKIGKFIRSQLPKILNYCDTVDHQEFARLCDASYSKQHFNINFPFLQEQCLIPADLSMRYWTDVHIVRGKTVRACSQWFQKDMAYFLAYLKRLGIPYDPSLPDADLQKPASAPRPSAAPSPPRTNRRYRGNAIGNAQNLLVRNVLSNLGKEQFTEEDWQETKAYFNHRCAYCGEAKELVIEHAIPINKQHLGEHRLGNLVPSCRACNSAKGSRDFRQFLGENTQQIRQIEAYMESRNYVPLEENEQVRMILEMAYREVGDVAERYIKIINQLFIADIDEHGSGYAP